MPQRTDFLSTSISDVHYYIHIPSISFTFHSVISNLDKLLICIEIMLFPLIFSQFFVASVAQTIWWNHISNGQRPWDDQTCAAAAAVAGVHGKGRNSHTERDVRDPARAQSPSVDTWVSRMAAAGSEIG